ncbi:MAG: ABC transporter ATP-binding protein [Granulosicoccus sp.]|nr:ABC transporter ATP-binding protein [Granulosicoccus sp.]
MQNAKSHGRAISLNAITKSWSGVVAVDQMNLDVDPGTFTVLLGPSGCGKSTSLRIIAGLEHADSGEISIGGNSVNDLPPSKRDIAMVFQSYALFPHLSVAENILFGLKVRRTSKSEQVKRLNATAELLGLTEYLTRKPAQLSGGQQQRVALGRAIIAQKSVCLMDEPLSNLDAKLRNTMRTEIRDLQQSLGFTMVYVTHDQAEAITMADQVVLMKDGRVEQAGTPREIYETPATEFVAGFIGTPPMNLIPAAEVGAARGQANSSFDDMKIGIRPEHVTVSSADGIPAVVEHVEYLGADVLADCRIGSSKLLARIEGHAMLAPNSEVRLKWPVEYVHCFDSKTGRQVSGDSAMLNALFS